MALRVCMQMQKKKKKNVRKLSEVAIEKGDFFSTIKTKYIGTFLSFGLMPP